MPRMKREMVEMIKIRRGDWTREAVEGGRR
jgi:hypothetical protein